MLSLPNIIRISLTIIIPGRNSDYYQYLADLYRYLELRRSGTSAKRRPSLFLVHSLRGAREHHAPSRSQPLLRSVVQQGQ